MPHASDVGEEEKRDEEAFFSSEDPIDVLAVGWHTRRDQGLSAIEEAEFAHWLASDPAHERAFQRLERGLQAVRAMPQAYRRQIARQWTDTRQRPVANPSGTRGHRVRAGVSWGWLFPRPALIAGCLAVALAAGAGWHQWQQQPTFSSQYTSERGGRLAVTLPDGTGVSIDADTQLEVVLYRDRREVRIRDGQAMFSVAADSDRPFHVLAGPRGSLWWAPGFPCGTARWALMRGELAWRWKRAGFECRVWAMGMPTIRLRSNWPTGSLFWLSRMEWWVA